MRPAPLALTSMVLAAALTLLPARVAAEKAYCGPTESGTTCGYYVDQTDCITRNDLRYCRTVQFYYWDSAGW